MEKFKSDRKFKNDLYLLRVLVNKSVRNQYRNSYLGIFWTVLNPLLNMIVMSVVFSHIFGRGIVGMEYPIYILSGNIIFNVMRGGTVSSLTCLVEQNELLTKTKVPILMFPTSQVFSAVSNFIFSFLALFLVMAGLAITGGNVNFSWHIVLTVALLPAVTLFTLGLSYVLSSLYVFFRDISHLYSVIINLWSYLTPLFYSIDIFGENKSLINSILKVNPMYYFVEYFRQLLMGQIPSWDMHVICYSCGIAMLLIGIIFYNLVKGKLVQNL